ncbi:MAG: hypothetical protein KAJ12_13185, partial [Bacteroidetes bacterium]|nr:hypothetical protein [Bacteroidota bacterium]
MIVGSVMGDVLIVDGDLSLRGQSEVMGKIQVVGGKAFSSKLARVKGGFEVYDYRLKVTHKGMKYHLMRRGNSEEGFMKLELRGFKGLSVGPYNRVDGLPLLFHMRLNDTGPGERWGLSLKGLYRIAAHRWGWDVFWEGRRVWKLSRIGLG